ncbi:MAG TPA: EAL domain-containing protein [Acidimicrobiales bacterium]|nr:EAL domain-containing protein [Acidimicrobiales bacterium]
MHNARKVPISFYLATLVSLFVLTAAAGVGYSKRRENDDATHEALVTAEFAAQQASGVTSTALSQLAAEVAQLAATPHLSEAFKTGCSLSFGGDGPFGAGELVVLRPDGSVACSSLPGRVSVRYAGVAAPARAASTPKLVGPFLDPATRRLAVAELVAIASGGAVAGIVELDSLGPGLAALYGGPEHLEFLVTNPDGTISLSRSLQPDRWTGADLSGTPFGSMAAGQGTEGAGRASHAVRRGVDGQWRIYGAVAVPGPGWKVYAGYSRAEALASADSVFRQELWIILAGLAVSGLAALVVARFIVAPVRQLARSVQKRTEGDGAVSIEPSGPAEVATLARGVSELVAAVDRELEQRREVERSYRHLFSDNPQPMWVYDLGTLRFLAVNDAAVEQYGYSQEDLAAMTIRDIPLSEEVAAMEATLEDPAPLTRSGPWRHLRKDGSLIDVEISSHTLRFDGRQARLVMAENITQSLAYERQLRELALRDQLTNLANRAVVLERIEECLAGGASTLRLAVLALGIDNFKDINDVHGHSSGDTVLREVAGRLRATTDGDTLGRIGAADFAVVCDHVITETDAIALASRLELAFARPIALEQAELSISVSVGIVMAVALQPPDEVLRDAVSAMHEAKTSGGGRFQVFNPAIRERTVAKVELASALRHAVERGELALHYQPEVDLASGEFVGAEALLRWAHRSKGLVPPAEFIPVAEETGSILSLGRWVLHEACRQAAEWATDQVGPPQVSVNLSARQLALPNLVSQVAEALDQADLEPAAICLELTETALMHDGEGALATLSALHDLGVQLSIDDFGTGYSSLLYLRRYPVDFLKIDRLFVAGLGSNPQDTAIASSVIGLAHSLGLRVVAEGVETDEQLAQLRDMGCDLGQGYLWSRPVPACDLPAVLAKRTNARA